MPVSVNKRNEELVRLTRKMLNQLKDKVIMNINFEWPTWMGDTPRQNTPWNDIEDQVLIDGYKSGMRPLALAKKHGRNVGGIDSRLAKLLGDSYQRESDRREKMLVIREQVRKLAVEVEQLLRTE